MKYTTYLAFKYLKPQKDRFFSYLSLSISIVGIALGVCALIVTLAVMSGFHREIRSRIANIYPHIIVTSHTKIDEQVFDNYKTIVNYSPFIYSQAILKINDKVVTTVVKGIDFEKARKIINLDKIVKSQFYSFSLKNNNILLGKELAKTLNVEEGNEITMVLPTQVSTPFGELPLTEKFLVVGIISSGIFEYDNNLCFIDYNKAKKIFTDPNTLNLNGVEGWDIKIKNDNKLNETIMFLKKNLPPFNKVLSWIEMNYNLFTALQLEKTMMFIIVSLIIIVACFIVVSNLLLKGMQKSKDIGILMAIGVDKTKIKKIFFLQGMIINISGVVLGLILGITLSLLIKQYQFVKLPKEIYYIDKVPIYFSLPDILSVLALTTIVGIIASIYPAHKISQFDPVEIIRYG